MLNTDEHYFLFLSLSLAGAATALDEAAEDMGFEPGFAASMFDGEWHVCFETLERLLRGMTEARRLLLLSDQHNLDLDTGAFDCPEECGHCGDLYQNEPHECYGTRGDAGEARMRYEYECQGQE